MAPAAASTDGWKFTWEAQSHASLIRLLLFNPDTDPGAEIRDLEICLLSEESLLTASFKEAVSDHVIQLRVPMPRVLIDAESLPQFKAFDNHIEIKLALLLPVAHPLISGFDSILNLEDKRNAKSLDSDLKKLSSMKEVHFYCRNCSHKLTNGLSNFHEMPSVNWRDVADNWFGNCCCSFGGVSEKLVASYAKSYKSAPGSGILSASTVLVCKSDLLGCELQDVKVKLDCPTINGSRALTSEKPDTGCCHGGFCTPELLETFSKVQISGSDDNHENERVFLDGYLGDGFMIRSAGISKDIKWNEYLCPQCSSLIGAYPFTDDHTPVDGAVRLFKCKISSCLPCEGSEDAFRDYTLERIFASQLLEVAQDELSYRTVVRDIQTKSMLLHIVLLNPNSWVCSGSLNPSGTDYKQAMHPTIKVLYAAPGHGIEFDSRTLEELVRKDQADEVYMFSSQISELVRVLKQANSQFPSSCASLQGLLLSSLTR